MVGGLQADDSSSLNCIQMDESPKTPGREPVFTNLAQDEEKV